MNTTDNGEQGTDDFGPGHPEWCPAEPLDPNSDERGRHMHCSHWSDCEPCCRCGDDTPDSNCDCPRCTYVRQATTGYTDGYHEAPDLEAPWPSGMCGLPRVCDHCPSNLLCVFKVEAEVEDGQAEYGAHNLPPAVGSTNTDARFVGAPLEGATDVEGGAES